MKYKIADRESLKINTMTKVIAADKEILLIRDVNGKYSAVSNKCTHMGAQLNEGILNNDRIVCPWHHACYNTTDGKVIEPPALHDLENYSLEFKNDGIYIEIPDCSEDEENLISKKNDFEKTFIIIGTGAAGRVAAQTLRNERFKGKIKMVSSDSKLPYDRTALSKDYLKGDLDKKDLLLQDDNYFVENAIEVILETNIVEINQPDKKIITEDNKTLEYDKLLIAMGSVPIMPFLPGSELQNIFTLRSYDDIQNIITQSKEAKKCVIVGSSFIAMETAASLTSKGLEITVVTKDKVPFETVLGCELGNLFLETHQENGINFVLETEPISFFGNKNVESVKLSNGKLLDADMVVIGIGVEPATKNLKGINKNSDGSITVDEYLKVSDDVFAAGDSALYPDIKNGTHLRIEHWRTAEQQGKTASLNMLGRNIKFDSIPFFWTNQFDLNIQYVGYAAIWDDVVIDGSLKDKKFLIYYLKDGKLKAVAGSNRDKELAAVEELMRLDKMPSINKIKKNPEELIEFYNFL